MRTQINATDIGALSAPEELTSHIAGPPNQRTADSLRLIPNWQTKTQTLRTTFSVATFAARKLPSGGSVRSAFITFELNDEHGKVIWPSGRSNDAGVITDQHGQPIAGEFWWKPDCSARLPNTWQPHYKQITAQNRAKIYEELINKTDGNPTTNFL